jgi:hypothetical protein
MGTMMKKNSLSTLVCLALYSTYGVLASESHSVDSAAGGEWSFSLLTLVMSVAAALSGVVLLVACASLCPKKDPGFRVG